MRKEVYGRLRQYYVEKHGVRVLDADQSACLHGSSLTGNCCEFDQSRSAIELPNPRSDEEVVGLKTEVL